MKTGLAIALALCLPVASVAAQACEGRPAVLRVSEVNSRPVFDAAVVAHTKWYRDKGVTDNQQLVLPVYKEPATRSAPLVIDSTRVITLHVNPPAGAGPARDAAWDAFVKQYAAASKVVATYIVCLPKTL